MKATIKIIKSVEGLIKKEKRNFIYKLNLIKTLNKRWKFKYDKKQKTERRGPDSESNTRYFKIPLCRNFPLKTKD